MIELSVSYVRVYAIGTLPDNTPPEHPDSPVTMQLANGAGFAKVSIGTIPADILVAMKQGHVWLTGLLHGRYKTSTEIQQAAAALSQDDILEVLGAPTEVKWFVTVEISDRVRLPPDPTQVTLGVTSKSFIDLESDQFFDKHSAEMDQIAVLVSAAIAPNRFKALVWNNLFIRMPTGLMLRPMRVRLGKARMYVSGRAAQLPVSMLGNLPVQTPPASLALVNYFYLRALLSTEHIARFMDAFRGIEALTRWARGNAFAVANANIAAGLAQPGTAHAAMQRPSGLRKAFATVAIAVRPAMANADYDLFDQLYDWRIAWAHGTRVLTAEEAPDDAAFDLLHSYIATVGTLML